MVFDTFAKNIENTTVFTVLKDFEFFFFFFFQIMGYYQAWLAGQLPGPGAAGWPAPKAWDCLAGQPYGSKQDI